MKKSFGLACTAAVLSTTALTSAPIANAAEGKGVTLDTVTVYATRSAESTFEVPAMVSTIDTDDAGDALATNISELLEFTPGVEALNGPRRNGQTVSIRGFDAQAVITLVDGRRQNFEAAHDGRFFVDPALLKRVEIVKGASSAIYGGGGIGGVVAFETKDAADFLKNGETSGATTSLGYRSANSEFTTNLSGYAVSGEWDLLANVAYVNSDDINLGGGADLREETDLVSGLVKAGYNVGDHLFKFQYQALHNNSTEPNNGAEPVSNTNLIVDKEVSDQQFSFKYEFDGDNDLFAPKIHLYHNISEVQETDIAGPSIGREQIREIKTYGVTLDNQSKFNLSDTAKNILSYGVEYYEDKQTGERSGNNGRPGVPNAEAETFGVYLQDEIKIGEGAGQLTLTPAVRYDSYESNDQNNLSQDEDKISPKFSAAFKPTEDTVIFGSWAKAFRAPNLTELYPTGQHFPGNNFTSNPNLKPEEVTTIEFGAGLNTNNVFAEDDALRIKGSWHKSDGKNFISQLITFIPPATTRFINIANATIEGWEVEAEYALAGFSAKSGLTFVTARDDSNYSPLSNSIPLTLTTDFSYKIEDDHTVGWRSRYAEENDRVSVSGHASTKGYGVHDLYYSYAPEENDNIRVDLGVENILDRNYARRLSALPEPGRSAVAKVTFKW